MWDSNSEIVELRHKNNVTLHKNNKDTAKYHQKQLFQNSGN